MRGRGTLVGAPGKVERRKRNANAETPRPGRGGRRVRSWYREMEELPGECRAYGASEIFMGVFPALTRWAKLFRTYGADFVMGRHGRSSMLWGTRSAGTSRRAISVWAAGSPERMERRLSVVLRARNFCSGSARWRCAWKWASRRVMALGTSSAGQRKPTGRAMAANWPTLPPTQK